MKKVEKKETLKNLESKINLNTLSAFADRKILFRLYNDKKGASRDRYENYRFSTNLKDAFINSFTRNDLVHDTKYNNKIKKLKAIVDIPAYLDINKKKEYLELISENKEYIKNNKVDNSIIETISFFEKRLNELK